MNLSDGYCQIEYRGKMFDISPSFANMAKLGTPEQIVQKMHDLQYYPITPIQSFSTALEILAACGLEDEEVTGGLNFSEWKNKVMIQCGAMHPDDVIVMARHCMQHGMCGSHDQLKTIEKGEGTQMSAFDPAEYIVLAMEYLKMTMDEAENLTMAKFVRLANAKREMDKRQQMKANGIPTKEESESRQKYNEDLAAQYEKARLARLAKKGAQ